MKSYVHWLKISGTVSLKEELRQYQEIQNYLDNYSDAKATIYLYDYHLFDHVVRLECHQNWNDLDLMANSMSCALRRLSRKPVNVINEQPFKIPERLI